MKTKCDVAIVGGGISGLLLGAILAKHDLDVFLFEKKQMPSCSLPETWLYREMPLFNKLGISSEIHQAFAFYDTLSLLDATGMQRVHLTYEDQRESGLVRVNKTLFTEALKKCALNFGVAYFEKHRVTKLQGHTLYIQNDEGDHRVNANVIVDASGKETALKSDLNLHYFEKKIDNRSLVFSHYLLEEGMSLKGIELIALENGYIFLIPMKGKRISVGCVASEMGATNRDMFKKTICESTYVSQLLASSDPLFPPVKASNLETVCLNPSGPHYFVIGEAGAFFDPFLSPGIEFALQTAEFVADSILSRHQLSYDRFFMDLYLSIKNKGYRDLDNLPLSSFTKCLSDPHIFPVFSLLLGSFLVNGRSKQSDLDSQNILNEIRGSLGCKA